MLKLEMPLVQIRGIGQKFLKRLEKLGVRTVRDLIWHFPFRYEDFSQIYRISDLEPGQQATIQGVVQEVAVRQSWRRHMVIVEALIADETGSIRAVWFNQPYLKNVLRAGRIANFAGKVSISENELYLSHPTYELVGRNETRHTGRLVPIYPETKGLTSKGIRFLIQPILKNLDSLPEWIPEEALREENLPELNAALSSVHFPEKLEDALEAKKRFAFENLLLLQLLNASQKLKLAKEKAPSIKIEVEFLKKIISFLPFELTVSQKKSLWEIVLDLEKQTPMNRLLQGDVGSGKTVVAAIAALGTALRAHQAAFLAPTEVLARQHFETLKKLFQKIPREYQPPIGLLTAASAKIIYENDLEAEIKKTKFAEELERGTLKIIVGTHALIQKSLAFHDLGLTIIDEQHRFGVEQRAALLKKNSKTGRKSVLPHFLSMSATPIPRTLMLTVFGDLDISTIDELPVGRKNIITKIVDPENRVKAYAFIRGQVKSGRQAFVICPRIEKDEHAENGQSLYKNHFAIELKSVKEEYEKLSQKIFPDLRTAMLHGQMPAKGARLPDGQGSASGGKPNKEQIMKDFRDGKIDILVSTSVIEVGVDVPNATVMMVEGSDRFGLAQLYQFRGRVGRGGHQSYCLLFTDSKAKTTHQRLKAILEAKNGFELAEKDLEIRGPGQFLGTEQTGLPDLAMQGVQDIELIKSSRRAAAGIIKKDPLLKNFPLLKEKLAQFKESIHLE